MAINLRGTKGSPLTHDELDQNFREFFYSGSLHESEIRLFRSRSLNPEFSIPYTTPNGLDTYIQIRSGSDLSGSGAVFTGSRNFTFDYDNHIFTLTGSSNFQGNLAVDGTVTATQYITTTVSSSVVFESGSTIFGNSDDDIHRFTGSVRMADTLDVADNIDAIGRSNKIRAEFTNTSDFPDANTYSGMFAHSSVEGKSYFATGSGAWVPLANSSSFATDIASNVSRVTSLEAFSASLDDTYATDSELAAATASVKTFATNADTVISSSTAEDIQQNVDNISILQMSASYYDSTLTSINGATSSYLQNTTDTLTGTLTVTQDLVVGGTVTAEEYHTELVSSSITYASGSNKFGNSSDDHHAFTGSVGIDAPNIDMIGTVDIQGPLSITGISNVSASIAEALSGSGNSNVNVTGNTNNRVLTATGTDSLNGEANLTFDGSTLTLTGDATITSDATINGTKLTKFTSADTDINSLLGGATSGSLIEGINSGHFVIGLQEDDLTDSFAIIGGGGDFYSNTNYDKILFRVSGSGNTYIGGNLDVSGSLNLGTDSISGGDLSINGDITATGDITAFYSSDRRLKDNITPITDALSKVKQIGGYEFDWNNNSNNSGHDVGVVAQEIEEVLPEIVANRDTGYKAVRYEKIVALLIEAIKEQQLQIDELKLDLLKSRT